MTVQTEPPGLSLKVFAVSADAWRLLGSASIGLIEREAGRDLSELRVPEVEQWAAELPTDRTSALWAELAELGMGTPQGTPTPAWAAAVVETTRPQIGIRVVSGYAGMSAVADLTVRGQRGMSVMRRRRLGPGPLDQAPVVADDMMLEVALFAATELWPAVRRTLPPLQELRAAPHLTRPRDRDEHTLDDDTAAEFRELAGTLGLESPGELLAQVIAEDPTLADALVDPVAVTTIALSARPDRADAPPALALRAWAVGSEGLHRLNLRPEVGPVVIDVEPGDVGFELVWLIAGAAEYLAEADRPLQGGR